MAKNSFVAEVIFKQKVGIVHMHIHPAIRCTGVKSVYSSLKSCIFYTKSPKKLFAKSQT